MGGEMGRYEFPCPGCGQTQALRGVVGAAPTHFLCAACKEVAEAAGLGDPPTEAVALAHYQKALREARAEA